MERKTRKYQLHHGDCLDFMATLDDKSVDAVITDPPYGIERFKKGFGTTRFKGHGVEKNGIEWDKKPTDKLFSEIFRVSKLQIIWGSNNFTLPNSQCFLVWNKHQTVDNFAAGELAYCSKKNMTAKIFDYSIHKHNHTDKQHPTQKPVPLMKWCSDLITNEGDTVFDPFMGSGTTGVACMQMGRNFIGCELDKGYFDIAEKRIYEATRQQMLF